MSSHAPTCRSITLLEYTDPVSPHVAAARDGVATCDAKMLDCLIREIKFTLGQANCTSTVPGAGKTSQGNLILVETAGGVLSPAPSGELQADAYRPLRLPVVLVGDGRLGGIGATLSGLESLKVRGYSVLGVILTAQGTTNKLMASCSTFSPSQGTSEYCWRCLATNANQQELAAIILLGS